MKVIVGIDITHFNYKHVHVPYIQTDTGRNSYLGIELQSGRTLDYLAIKASNAFTLYQAWQKLMLAELLTLANNEDKTALALHTKLSTVDAKILIVE